ncbi:hypothetical protein pb186bvf_001888 [Paramecium bursaria]
MKSILLITIIQNIEIQVLISKIEKTSTFYTDKIRQADIQSESTNHRNKKNVSINVRDQEIDNLSNQRQFWIRISKEQEKRLNYFKNTILIEKEKSQQLEDFNVRLIKPNQQYKQSAQIILIILINSKLDINEYFKSEYIYIQYSIIEYLVMVFIVECNYLYVTEYCLIYHYLIKNSHKYKLSYDVFEYAVNKTIIQHESL